MVKKIHRQIKPKRSIPILQLYLLNYPKIFSLSGPMGLRSRHRKNGEICILTPHLMYSYSIKG